MFLSGVLGNSGFYYFLSTLFAGVGAAVVGTIVARLIATRRLRITVTNELFRYYHSPEMISARQHTWHFLDKINQKANTPSFRELWENSDEGAMRNYFAVVQVVYFWLQVHTLKQERIIDKILAKRFFAYQFRHWKNQITPLYHATKQKDSKKHDLPEWLVLMEPGETEWLTT